MKYQAMAENFLGARGESDQVSEDDHERPNN